MSWTNRIAWREGMFLRPQHFQQQDRWTDATARATRRDLTPYGWGFSALRVAGEWLESGRFALEEATGAFDDGAIFQAPGEADLPPPLDISADTRNALIYLALPIAQPGGMEIGDSTDPTSRHHAALYETGDTHSPVYQRTGVDIGRLAMRFVLETSDRSGLTCLPVARIVEVLPDRKIILDRGWIPPVVNCRVVPALASLIVELTGLLHQRGEAIAARVNAVGSGQSADIADFMLLQAVNGWQTLLQYHADSPILHPESLFRTFVEMAGTLSTYTSAARRPERFKPYRHDDLQESFAPVVAALRRSLSAVLEQNAVRIDLQERRHGVRVGALNDRSLLDTSHFVLVVQADMQSDQLRRLFPASAKIGAVEHIRELVNVALPGIELQPLPVAPRQMPFIAGATYFELDRHSAHWRQMQASGGFAIHISGEFPGLALDLWAVRG